MSDMKAGASPARAEAERIAAANGGSLGLSREAAAEYLKGRGIEPRPGSTLADYKPPAYGDAAYRNLDLVGVRLDPEADAAGVIDGAKVFASALQLDPTTAAAVTRDMAGAGDVDADAVRAHVERAGYSYDDAVRDADALIAEGSKRRGSAIPIAAKDLSATTLLTLAVTQRFRAERAKP